MAMSDYSSCSLSPLRGPRGEHNFSSPYSDVKKEMDFPYSRHPSHGGVCSYGYSQHQHLSFYPSPHSMSSCMYKSSMSPGDPMALSPDRCGSIPSCTKENQAMKSSPNCRRKLDFNHNAFVDPRKTGPFAVAKRNMRERNRVKFINMTFHTLRQHLPLHTNSSKGKARKLSKVQTLRSAIDYIRELQGLIEAKTEDQTNRPQGKTCSPSTAAIGFCCVSEKIKEEIQSPERHKDLHNLVPCQNRLRYMGSCSTDDLNSEKVPTHPCSRDMKSSSPASSSTLESPTSESSEPFAMPEEVDFLDFEDWF